MDTKVRAKKRLGQHFLTDLSIARRIVDAVGGGRVLEVGGGMGVLTQFLLERVDIELWGVELDGESVAYMRERFPEFSPRLVEGDFLKMDLREFTRNERPGEGDCEFSRLNPEASRGAEGKSLSRTLCRERSSPEATRRRISEKIADDDASERGEVRVVGNFPYNISSQIFFKVLENRDLVPEVVGMVQREVAQRMAEGPGSRTYGILSVLLQAWYDIEYLFTVGEGVFTPPPRVKSAVVRLRRNGRRELGCDEELFVRVVKAAFGQRRKMLRNALRSVFGDMGGEEHAFFTRRAETLSVAEFVELTNWINLKIT